MNQKFTYVVLALYALAYLLLFGSWFAIACHHDQLSAMPDLLAYIKEALIGLTAHVMTLINSGSGGPPPAVVTQPAI